MPEPITPDQVRHVAKLARLELDDQQINHLTGEMSAVLAYISKLNELDITDIEPMAHAGDVQNALRQDLPTPGLPVETALANSPASDPPFFKVPKVLGDAGSA